MTTANILQAGSSIIIAIIAGGGTWLIAKMQHKGRPENAMIDQMQENITRSDARLDAALNRIDRLEQDQAASKRREHKLGDYVNSLRIHIAEEKGPPPPPWPADLYL